MQRLRAWTYRHQLLDRPAGTPLEALRAVGAVYSAHPSGPLSLLARSKPFTPTEFGALERRRQAVRITAMRASAFLVPAEDAARIFTACGPLGGELASRLRGLGLDEADYTKLKPRILRATATPITPRELTAAMDTEPSAVVAMRLMAREGLILRVGWADRVRSDSLRWVSTESWLGRRLDDADHDESRRWLAEAYLRAFGPARAADFAWWSGLPRRQAGVALEGVETTEVAPEFLLLSDQAAAWDKLEPIAPEAVHVIPKWDPFTMGHAPDGRRRLVDDEHLKLAFSTADNRIGATAGDGLPLILRGGRAIASWSHRLDGERMTIKIAQFGRPRLPSRSALERAFEPIGTLLNAAVQLS